jgi:hypothetical protein
MRVLFIICLLGAVYGTHQTSTAAEATLNSNDNYEVQSEAIINESQNIHLKENKHES